MAAVTVYATFGSKRAVLDRLVDVSIVGDEQPIPLLAREGPRKVRLERDQARQIAMFADDVAGIMERMSPLFETLRSAAEVEPEIEPLLARLHAGRLEGMRFLVDAVASNGPLRDGQSKKDAAETVWAVSSPDVHRLLTHRLGWSSRKYASWLQKTVSALLLPARRPTRPGL